MIKRITFLAAALALILSAPHPARAQLPADQMTTLTLPDPKPNWVYIMDIQFPVEMLQKIWIVDGDSRSFWAPSLAGTWAISKSHPTIAKCT